MRYYEQTAPYFAARRLILTDVGAAHAIYDSIGRDGVWADDASLRCLVRHGEVWGGFSAGSLQLCGGLCAINTKIPLCDALRDAELHCGGSMVFLPPVCLPDSSRYAAAFLDMLLARFVCLGASDAVLPLPVKTGAALLPAIFGAGFSMVAVRPLVQLRPHYIFCKSKMKNNIKNSIMVQTSDTLALARLLENGYVACGMSKEVFYLRDGKNDEISNP